MPARLENPTPKQLRDRVTKLRSYHKHKERAKAYRQNNIEADKANKRAYYRANKEAVKSRSAEYAKTNPDRRLTWDVKQYGLSSICSGPPTSKRKRLSVDHNHSTGRIRALLCAACNTLLGLANESKQILDSAIEYLNKHTEVK